MVTRLKVPEPVEHPEYNKMYPPEYWELVEMTMAQVPAEAVHAYRDVVIGKGKGMPKLIKARHADIALRAGLMQHFGTDDPERMAKLAKNNTVPWPEPVDDMLSRQAWYIKNGWPVILVRQRGYGWLPRVIEFVAERIPMGHEVRLFEFDDAGVDRLPVPKSWSERGKADDGQAVQELPQSSEDHPSADVS